MKNKSYLGKRLDIEFKEAIESGKKLADFFLTIYEEHAKETIEEFVLYVDADMKEEYQLCYAIQILPAEILASEVGLVIVAWNGYTVELKWSGK